MKPPWTPEERLGCYPDHDEMRYVDEEGVAFDPKRLDMEGRAVVCDFGYVLAFATTAVCDASRRHYS
jgi:AP endonuclease-2